MIRKQILDNGLTILTETMPGLKSVSLGVWLKTGSRHETAQANGISHFIEHLVFKGTARRTAQEIALIIDSIGGQVDAFTGKEYTCFFTRVLDEHLDVATDLLSDIVLSPRFAEEDIEKERKVIYEEIRMVEDTPDELLYDVLSQQYWKGHPLGRPIQGTRRTVSALTPGHLSRHFRRSYRPENMVIAAAGNLEHGPFVRAMRTAFDPLPAGRVNGKVRPPRAPASRCSS
jgi:predicted Zn-dependent peptidase